MNYCDRCGIPVPTVSREEIDKNGNVYEVFRCGGPGKEGHDVRKFLGHRSSFKRFQTDC